MIQSTITSTGSGSPAVISKPSGVISSDLLIIGFTFEKGNNETITPPAGWTLIRRTNNSSDCGLATYSRIAGASEPASYSFSFNNGSKWCIGISRITNANTTEPIVFSSATGSSNSPTAASVTTSGPNRLIMSFYTNKSSSSFSHPSGTYEAYDAPNTAHGMPSNMMAWSIQEIAGATGARVATTATAERWAAQQVVIVPQAHIPLPIELIGFDASICSPSSVCLEWTTATELNNDHFTVERSQDGMEWRSIRTIPGAGNSQVLLVYTVVDEGPLAGTSYYRLKQTDLDQRSSYSPVRAITRELLLVAYPNPTTGPVTIATGMTGVVDLRIFNSVQQDVTGMVRSQGADGSARQLDLSALGPGIYLIRSGDQSVRILKQ